MKQNYRRITQDSENQNDDNLFLLTDLDTIQEINQRSINEIKIKQFMFNFCPIYLRLQIIR